MKRPPDELSRGLGGFCAGISLVMIVGLFVFLFGFGRMVDSILDAANSLF